jgi:acetyl-CoA C-acetyltransferase
MRMGDKTVVDSMMHDGLFCAIDQWPWARHREVRRSSRASTATSRTPVGTSQRARRRRPEGRLFDNEIIPVAIPQRKGDPIVLEADEGVRGDTTIESLGKLRPAFDKDGNITAGNASRSPTAAPPSSSCSKLPRPRRLGLKPLGEIVGDGQVAGPDASLLSQPAQAIKAASAAPA